MLIEDWRSYQEFAVDPVPAVAAAEETEATGADSFVGCGERVSVRVATHSSRN